MPRGKGKGWVRVSSFPALLMLGFTSDSQKSQLWQIPSCQQGRRGWGGEGRAVQRELRSMYTAARACCLWSEHRGWSVCAWAVKRQQEAVVGPLCRGFSLRRAVAASDPLRSAWDTWQGCFRAQCLPPTAEGWKGNAVTQISCLRYAAPAEMSKAVMVQR